MQILTLKKKGESVDNKESGAELTIKKNSTSYRSQYYYLIINKSDTYKSPILSS